MNRGKHSVVDNLFFTKLYKEDKRYFWGLLIFFVLLVSIPAFLHRGIPPLFRGWGLFKDKQYLQPSYSNIKIVVNDDTACNVFQTQPDFSQLALYLDFVQTKTDNQNYPYHKIIDLFFPKYASQHINFLSDTLAFPRWYKRSLSKLMHVPVKKVSVYKETIIYDKNGYAVLQSVGLLKEF